MKLLLPNQQTPVLDQRTGLISYAWWKFLQGLTDVANLSLIQPQALFGPVTITSNFSTVYTVPTSPTSIVLANARMRLTNPTVTTASVTFAQVPATTTVPAVAQEFMVSETVTALSHVDIDIPVLSAGQQLQGKSTTVNIDVFQISGNINS